jgi:hypothetical protein
MHRIFQYAVSAFIRLFSTNSLATYVAAAMNRILAAKNRGRFYLAIRTFMWLQLIYNRTEFNKDKI